MELSGKTFSELEVLKEGLTTELQQGAEALCMQDRIDLLVDKICIDKEIEYRRNIML